MNIWNKLRYFDKRENWGKPDKIDPKFLLILDAYRHELGIPLYISKGYSPKGLHDFEDSAHYESEDGYSHAVDLFPLLSNTSGKTLFDCFILATRYPFSGIGIYPHWRLSRIAGNGKIMERGGLHLDNGINRFEKLPLFRASGHWIGYQGENNKQDYEELSRATLSRYKLI